MKKFQGFTPETKKLLDLHCAVVNASCKSSHAVHFGVCFGRSAHIARCKHGRALPLLRRAVQLPIYTPYPLTCTRTQCPLTSTEMQYPVTCKQQQQTCAGMQHSLTCAGRQCPLTCAGMQDPLTCAGMQDPLTCAGMHHSLTCAGMQHPLTCAGMQHPLTCAGMQLPLTCAGMQDPLTCAGMHHSLTCAGMQHPLTRRNAQFLCERTEHPRVDSTLRFASALLIHYPAKPAAKPEKIYSSTCLHKQLPLNRAALRPGPLRAGCVTRGVQAPCTSQWGNLQWRLVCLHESGGTVPSYNRSLLASDDSTQLMGLASPAVTSGNVLLTVTTASVLDQIFRQERVRDSQQAQGPGKSLCVKPVNK